jgi:hypothetical protein
MPHVFNSSFELMIMKKIMLFICVVLLHKNSAAQEKAGFFLDGVTPRTAELPDHFVVVEKPADPSTVRVTVDFNDIVSPVSPYLFGNNANVFMTQMIDQPVLIGRIKTLSPNILRFPGGNLSSVFFWNALPAKPPADAPPKLVDGNGVAIDAGYWYGKNNESWTLSVDNYYAMLQATNSTAIITINYGYARYGTASDPVAEAAHLAADWVRYDNGRTKFWEIGNESNGSWQAGYRINTADNKDGQPAIITGALYGRHFKVFADSMRKAASEKQVTIYLGAQLLAEAPASWWNDTDRNWNHGVFQNAENSPDYYVVHSYYTPYQQNSGAADILSTATSVTRSMMEYVSKSVSDAGVSQKPVALTEWNIFAEGSKQQVSYISGMHAAIVLGELIRGGYGLACRWDLANGWANGNDHGMFSQGDEPGVPKWNPRPVYYYMYYFQKYFGDGMVHTDTEGNPRVLAYGSRFRSGEVGVMLVNTGKEAQIIRVDVDNFGYGDRFYYYTLTGGSDNGDFSRKVVVNGETTSLVSGGPPDPAAVLPRSADCSGGVKLVAPARSVQYVLIEHGDNVITGTAGEEPIALEIFPNPATETIKVVCSSPGLKKLEIRDLRGHLVYRREQTEVSVDLEIDLPPGMYWMLVYKGKDILHRQVFIY